MFHPSIYVLVTDLDDMEEIEAASVGGYTAPTAPASTQQQQKGISSEASLLAAIAANSSSNNNNNAKNNDICDQKFSMDVKPASLASSFAAVAAASSSASTTVQLLCGENRQRIQPFYDTQTTSFTCNTTNTHAPQQAATEMPEHAWQDCITNKFHVSADAAAADASIKGSTEDDAASEMLMDIKPNIAHITLQQQQQLKDQKLWEFVDPCQKAPCICTK